MTPNPVKHIFSLQSDPKNLQPFLKNDLAPLLKKAGFADKVKDTLLVAFGEAITNCIRHSYDCRPSEKIEITVEDHSDKMVFTIRDQGEPADLKKIESKTSPKLPPENPGGLGVYFIKTIMDSVKYKPAHPKGNELIMVKKK